MQADVWLIYINLQVKGQHDGGGQVVVLSFQKWQMEDVHGCRGPRCTASHHCKILERQWTVDETCQAGRCQTSNK